MGQQESKQKLQKKTPAVADLTAATLQQISELTELTSTLEKRSEYLSVLMANDVKEAIAKKKAGDTNGAMIALKRKKLKEAEVEQLSSKLLNVEQMKFSLQTAAHNADYVNVLQKSRDQLARLQAGVSADDVHDLMADLSDTLSDQRDVNSILAEHVGPHGDADDAELMAELDELSATPAATAAASAAPRTGQRTLPSAASASASRPAAGPIVVTHAGTELELDGVGVGAGAGSDDVTDAEMLAELDRLGIQLASAAAAAPASRTAAGLGQTSAALDMEAQLAALEEAS